MSTSFQITQIQEDLTQARSREVTRRHRLPHGARPSSTAPPAGCSRRRASPSTIPRSRVDRCGSASAARSCLGNAGREDDAMNDSSFGRLIGVLVAPGKTFRSIAERPTWVVAPLVLLVLLAAGRWFVRGAAARLRGDGHAADGAPIAAASVARGAVGTEIEVMEQGRAATSAVCRPGRGARLLLIVAAALLGRLQAARRATSATSRACAVTLHACMPAAVAALLNIPLILARETLGSRRCRPAASWSSNLAPSRRRTLRHGAHRRCSAASTSSRSGRWCCSIIGYTRRSPGSPRRRLAATVILLWLLFVADQGRHAAAFLR